MISSNKEDGTLSDRDYGYNIYNLFIWKDGLTKMANAAGYENNYTQSGNTLSWYGEHEIIQFNQSPYRYYWIGIG